MTVSVVVLHTIAVQRYNRPTQYFYEVTPAQLNIENDKKQGRHALFSYRPCKRLVFITIYAITS